MLVLEGMDAHVLLLVTDDDISPLTFEVTAAPTLGTVLQQTQAIKPSCIAQMLVSPLAKIPLPSLCVIALVQPKP